MNIVNFDLAGVLSSTVSPLELMLRGTLMYWFLFIVFRFVLRRDVGSLGISDFLFVVRRELITDEALNAKIRQEGVEDLATVKRMNLEEDGEMSLIRIDGSRGAA